MEQYVEIFKILGVGGGFFIAFMVLMRWVLKQQEKMHEDAKTERAAWLETIKQLSEKRVREEEKSRAFERRVNEAHEFQREEHKEMVKSLGQISTNLQVMNGRSPS